MEHLFTVCFRKCCQRHPDSSRQGGWVVAINTHTRIYMDTPDSMQSQYEAHLSWSQCAMMMTEQLRIIIPPPIEQGGSEYENDVNHNLCQYHIGWIFSTSHQRICYWCSFPLIESRDLCQGVLSLLWQSNTWDLWPLSLTDAVNKRCHQSKSETV